MLFLYVSEWNHSKLHSAENIFLEISLSFCINYTYMVYDFLLVRDCKMIIENLFLFVCHSRLYPFNNIDFQFHVRIKEYLNLIIGID